MTIVLGGHLATFSASELLQDNVDFIVRGEGEETFLELVNALSENNTDFGHIQGIVFKKEGNIIESPARPLIKNLDSLPFPDRSHTQEAIDQGSLVQISGSRGCQGNCSFCSINSLYRLSDGEARRGRSPESIVQELKYLKENFGSDIFKFVDDSFFGYAKGGKKRGLEIAQRIIDEKLGIRFRVSTRADNVDYELFSLLKKAGLYSVSIGIESGHQRALNTFNKGIDVETNKKALKILKDLEIITLMGFIGFDPYTTLQECEENIEFLKEMEFALCDIISKPLFVHAKDPITQILLAEGKLQERDFPNYNYSIEEQKSASLHTYLKKRNTINKDLYYEITDMLTAPRITTPEQEAELITLYQSLRKIDLQIYESLLSFIKNDAPEDQIQSFLTAFETKTIPILADLRRDFYTLVS